MNKFIMILVCLFLVELVKGQGENYWQQKARYQIHADVDVKAHSLVGKQVITYFNNSPDTLKKMYFHLYYNAFKKGSMMDVRSSYIPDPEHSIEKKFLKLKDDDQGDVSIMSLKCNGVSNEFHIYETIIKTNLSSPIIPGDSIIFELEYITRIPVMIRRAGRESEEGIDYSMAQWYPKIVAYDDEGFHPDIYIGKEFYGVFSDFDVKIDIDKKYFVAAGGKLINKTLLDNEKCRYHFQAKMIHDFVWSADQDYVSYSVEADSTVTFNFYYQDTKSRNETWKQLGMIMKEAYSFMIKRYGRYQYDMYNFIEGGDGGMEYPLATFITGDRNLNSLVGVSVHEFLHSWYHTMIATNESSYHWMDEGFTTLATVEVLQHLISKKLIDRKFPDFPYKEEYGFYSEYTKSYHSEPMNVHADHYNSNYAYGVSAYIGGMIFLKQLEYIVGKETFDKGLLRYFNKWKFKSPKPIDFMRVMENQSDMELRWYLEYFVNRSTAIDFGIDTVYQDGDYLNVELVRKTIMPMPVDLTITYSDGTTRDFNIPVDLTFGSKKSDVFDFEVLKVWKWIDYRYSLKFFKNDKEIISISLDPSLRLADIDRTDNEWKLKE